VTSIARDDPSRLPGMHRDHNVPACTATRSACPHTRSACRRIVGCDHHTW